MLSPSRILCSVPASHRQEEGGLYETQRHVAVDCRSLCIGCGRPGAMVHPYWNYFAVIVAANLIQSAFTGWCPMMALLRKLGVQE